MPKPRRAYLCRSCGALQSRWMGKCPDCGAWDALEEQVVEREPAAARADPQRGIVQGWAALDDRDEDAGGDPAALAVPIGRIGEAGAELRRIPTGIAELDRVLGGGLVPGSAVLIGGDPGIGKSTLMLQMAGRLGSASGTGVPPVTAHHDRGTGVPPVTALDTRVLYVSSEESAQQVRMRAARLGVASSDHLYVLADTNLARIVEQARKIRPRVMVIDSVQMIYKGDLEAAPGSISQLRRCCADLVYLAKLSGIAIILVGHVTKEGTLAGPRLLEHLVDTVVYFEGDRYHAHRVVRAIKNRYGTTLEIGLFEMTGEGLIEAPQGASAAALEGMDEPRPGSVACPVMTGTRCVLVEIQALTATGFLGSAKRKSSGLDANRLAMIIAVLEQHAEIRLADRDVFASSVGGLRIVEPAADLALALAVAGAQFRRGMQPRTGAVGEVGLGGEVRPVPQMESRLNEAARLGFSRLIVPASGVKGARQGPKGLECLPVRSVNEAIALLR